MDMIYFTSDTHFGHKNIIKHTGRPFYSIQEMDDILVRNWNRKVGVYDDIYILGDVSMKGAEYVQEILVKLNGRKYLVRGNHDKFADQEGFDKNIFVWIKDYYELKYKNEKFILFHYPIEEWNQFFRDAIHLHGHQHNHEDYNYQNLEKGLRRFDVGVDANNMFPVSIEEIIEFFHMGNEDFDKSGNK